MNPQLGRRHGGEGGSLDGGAVVGMGLDRGRKAPEDHPQAGGGKRQGGGGCRLQDWRVEAHGLGRAGGEIQAGGRMEGHGGKEVVRQVLWGG